MINTILHIISFTVVLLYLFFFFKQKKNDWVIYFLGFLISISLIDFIAYTLQKKGIDTLFLYNIIMLFEFNFLFIFFLKIVKRKPFKKIIKIVILIFNISYIVTLFYYGIHLLFKTFNTISVLIGSALIGIVSILYLREFLLSDKITNYKKDNTFWITTGILVYYIGAMPLIAIINYLTEIPPSGAEKLFYIMNALTIFMHCCFIIGVIWSLKKVK